PKQSLALRRIRSPRSWFRGAISACSWARKLSIISGPKSPHGSSRSAPEPDSKHMQERWRGEAAAEVTALVPQRALYYHSAKRNRPARRGEYNAAMKWTCVEQQVSGDSP